MTDMRKKVIQSSMLMNWQRIGNEEQYGWFRRKFVRYWSYIIIIILTSIILLSVWIVLFEKEFDLLNWVLIVIITFLGLFMIQDMIKQMLYTRKLVKWYHAKDTARIIEHAKIEQKYQKEFDKQMGAK